VTTGSVLFFTDRGSFSNSNNSCGCGRYVAKISFVPRRLQKSSLTSIMALSLSTCISDASTYRKYRLYRFDIDTSNSI